MGKRTFEQLSVIATGVQSGDERYGKRRRFERDDLPPLSQWRCNLTGLSQEHNLYFIAYGRNIYVYVPQFPTQIIPREPSLIVPSQPTSPGLLGYLDPHEPHNVNNLIVQRLGRDEVIATVRDDGDVNAVLVRHIVQAIERRAQPDSTIGVVADDIRPIFQENVGISAWGLAIHSEARILATSSNAHEVRVFKFGLTQGGGDDDAVDDREMDVTQRVLNGNANIPCIAFCNTGDDPEGRWLLTTDVPGYCRTMDLQSMHGADVTVQQFRFGRSYPPQASGFDRSNAGWGVMFLDRRSFQPEKDFRAAVGLDEDGRLPGSRENNSRTWDLTNTVDLVAENSPAFVYNDPRQGQGGSQRRVRSVQNLSQRGSEERAVSERHDSDHDHNAEAEAAAQLQHIAPDAAAQEELVLQALDDLDDTMTDSPEPSDEDEANDDFDDDDDGMLLLDEDDDPDDEGTEDTISYNAMYGGKRIFGNQPYFLHQNSLCDDLPCPIMHMSVRNVYLLQPSNQRYSPGAFSPPMVGLANPLRQAVQSQIALLNMFDRLNMHAYIPNLGVVVVASQKGRVMVLSLTKISAGARYPDDMREQRHKSNYAMRVECTLPFEQQEKEKQRPFAPLHGIAASPVQGAGTKRWRLMMMYQDHSILSYEIARPSARGSAVDIGGLVV